MGYKDPIQPILEAFYGLINGQVSTEVYLSQAPEDEGGNYVLLRAEGSNTTKINSGFFTSVVIVTEIVTQFTKVVETKTANEIDEVITELLFPTANSYGITDVANHHITDIILQTTNYVNEFEGAVKYLTKVNRYEFILNQK